MKCLVNSISISVMRLQKMKGVLTGLQKGLGRPAGAHIFYYRENVTIGDIVNWVVNQAIHLVINKEVENRRENIST